MSSSGDDLTLAERLGISPDRLMMAVFGLVTLVLGLIGLAISAGVDSIEPPSTLPSAGESGGAGSSTTTSTSISNSATTTISPRSSSTSVTTAGDGASLEVSTESVDLGDEATSGEFEVRNTGEGAGEWSAVSSTEAISLSAESGELAGGESTTIDLTLDRAASEEGDIAEIITVTWSGGQIQVAVVGANEANPIIHNPRANPSSVQVSGSSQCSNTRTTVTAKVTDASPLESVVVHWSPDGSTQKETPMTPAGDNAFEAVIGPFTVVQTADVRVLGFDDRGNAGGAGISVTVVACP